ncbi:MAG: thrombospondin type 3 repeat-containing protein [Thalassotalea sp.]|nr:thrombospondin type 3 repeat-containing protein [Thalassotalea sp.]
MLKRGDTGEVVIARPWLESNEFTIDGDVFYQPLKADIDAGRNITLVQQVTTSDTFTVVQSDATNTEYTLLTGSDGDGLSDEQEASLGTDPNVVDSDGDGVEYFLKNTGPVPTGNSGDNGDSSGSDGSGSDSSDGDSQTPVTPATPVESDSGSGGGGSLWILNALLLALISMRYSKYLRRK